MDLRRLTLTVLASIGCATSARAASIHINPLDERIVYTVRISRDEPTTCLFPAGLTALEGGNVSGQAADQPPVLLSYQPGAAFFSVRALRDDAKAAINVVFCGKVYVLSFQTAAEADRAVSFSDEIVAPPTVAANPDRLDRLGRLKNLIERAKRHDLVSQQYPALAQATERASPRNVTRYPGFAVTIAEVFRFGAEDTLVFRVELANAGDTPLRFDPSGLAIRIGPNIHPAALAEATGEVPARSTSVVWFAIVGGAEGRRADLSVRNTFFVLVPRLP